MTGGAEAMHDPAPPMSPAEMRGEVPIRCPRILPCGERCLLHRGHGATCYGYRTGWAE